ncbi:LamG domain-containing protein [Catellatospora chokoriensis]|nr:LamG domain-containing protein [Catellatospora chokoriensis]
MALASGALMTVSSPSAAAAPCGRLAGTAGEAAAMAAACGTRVEIDESRTELTTTYANPDGTRTFESSVVPLRARKADGSWADVDLALAEKGGALRPKVSAADVRFSIGGAEPLVTLVKAGKTMTMSWPGNLPAPTVTGDSATYAGVLPDVDLVVRATHTGFTHVLVIKTPAAAANPAVRQIQFGIGGDAKLQARSGGRMVAQAGNVVLAAAQAPVMWDSKDDTPAAAQRRSALGAELAGGTGISSAVAPGDRAGIAPVQATPTAGGLTLAPDTKLLSDPANFPVYVDPAWDSVDNPRWAYATSNNENNDTTGARVGLNPATGALYRSFFEFPTTGKSGGSLKGKYIHSAYVQMGLDHSWSCGDTPSYMYAGPALSGVPKASWSAMTLTALSTAASVSAHANEGSGCADSPQPDVTVNYTGNGVRDHVRSAASGNWNLIVFGFSAGSTTGGSGESTQDRWKRFYTNKAKLIVDYDSTPGKPNALQVSGVTCPTTGVMGIGTLTPTLSAMLPDADSQTLRGAFEWVEVPASGNPDEATVKNRVTPDPTATANTRATTVPITITAGKTYAYHVTAVDAAPYSQWSGWGAWCQFKADTAKPIKPTVTVTGGGTRAGGEVTITLSTTETDVTKFRYSWSGTPTTEVAATGTSPKTATVKLTVPRFGTNTLSALAVDNVNNVGNLGTAEINVGRPAPPVAQWGLETYPGVDQAGALSDAQPAPANSPLTATNVTWTKDSRLVGGHTAAFNGSTSLAATSGSVVNTAGSFSVAAWARLGVMPTADYKILTQEGADAAGFSLGVRFIGDPAKPYWTMVMKDTSAQGGGSTTKAAYSPVEITTADVGKWTHLAAVYDAPAKKMRLYVNGELKHELDRPATPWSATGKFVIGRGFGAGVAENWWNGQIADVQAFDRALVAQDFTGQLASEAGSSGFDEPGMLSPLKVGTWDFTGLGPCWEPMPEPGLCEALEFGGFARRLSLTAGTDVSQGLRGEALWLNKAHWDTTLTDPTTEFGWSQSNTATPENPVWQDGSVLRTDDSFTVSAWARLDDAAGNHAVVSQRGNTESAFALSAIGGKWSFNVADADNSTAAQVSAQSVTPAQVGEWTHLVGVYDAGRRQLRLYVNGVLERTTALTWDVMASTGTLTVGRTRYHGADIDYLLGSADEVAVYQGAMTDAQVKSLNDSYDS